MGTARSTVALASSLFVAVALAGSLLVTVGLFIAIGLLFAAGFVGFTLGFTLGLAVLAFAVGTLALFFAALCLSLVAVGRLGNSRCGNYRSSGNTGQEKKFLHITIRLISFDANIARCVCESRVVNLIFSKSR